MSRSSLSVTEREPLHRVHYIELGGWMSLVAVVESRVDDPFGRWGISGPVVRPLRFVRARSAPSGDTES